MTEGSRWHDADDGALTWLSGVATEVSIAWFAVDPMPDKVCILHPMFERIDGKPMHIKAYVQSEEVWADPPDAEDAPVRRVRWTEYVTRHGISIADAVRQPNFAGPLADLLDRDEYVVSYPDEGSIEDTATQQAIFEVLTRHTAGGADTLCTAFFYEFGVTSGEPVLRGPLGAWPELFDRDDRAFSPQNLWPDTHKWVLETNTDAWETTVSGTTDLIDELLASSELEAIRR